MQCPKDLFHEFEKCVDSDIAISEKVAEFAYEAMATDMDYLGMIHPGSINVPDDALQDWYALEMWLDEYRIQLDQVVTAEIYDADDPDELETKPVDYFRSKEGVIKAVVRALSARDDMILGCVEITCDGKSLYLIYEDSDAWSLGHADLLLVVSSLDQLTEERGFYDEIRD